MIATMRKTNRTSVVLDVTDTTMTLTTIIKVALSAVGMSQRKHS